MGLDGSPIMIICIIVYYLQERVGSFLAGNQWTTWCDDDCVWKYSFKKSANVYNIEQFLVTVKGLITFKCYFYNGHIKYLCLQEVANMNAVEQLE